MCVCSDWSKRRRQVHADQDDPRQGEARLRHLHRGRHSQTRGRRPGQRQSARR